MLSVIAETNQWIVVNKPASLNVEQLWDYDSVETDVKNYLIDKGIRKPFVGVVHRLDRPVSGVLILAKKKGTLRFLNEQFSQKNVKKKYWAILDKEPPVGKQVLTHYLIKDQKNKCAKAVEEDYPKAIEAILFFTLIASKEGKHLIEVEPQSGKFHQIRIQLATAGFPIIGDEKYGSASNYLPDQIALHAQYLEFTKTGALKMWPFQAATPVNDLWKMFSEIEEEKRR